MKKDLQEIMASLSIEEKASLCSGKDFWTLKEIARKDIPGMTVADGPHGLRKQQGDVDHVGLQDSVPATCFPTAAAMACSWDTGLMEEVGRALAEECRREKVGVILGPGVNIKRSPLCGRNFEYFSEDPVQGGKMAAALIRGVQSCGVGTSLKHFAVNNQERRRMVVNAVVDPRALREVYLTGFEIAVKEGKPDTVMCAYNRLNGSFCSENRELLTAILKEEWGFTGFTVTDWGASNDRVEGLRAGMDLEMPASGRRNERLIVEAVQKGELEERVLDEAVERVLRIVFQKAASLKDESTFTPELHHELARRTETESAVLLKNDGILPLKSGGTVAVLGAFAEAPRYQGSGSSLINPTRLDNALAALRDLTGGPAELLYAPGYDPRREESDGKLLKEAVAAAAKADTVIVFAGLPEVSESEGFDRAHLSMPEAHNTLIEKAAEVNANIVVVLSNGAPVTMPWLPRVRGVLESYLGGQAWGPAVADLLYGTANPCGKLAETFPLSLQDVPASPNFPGGHDDVLYTESIYVGYRYYEAAEREVLFPFGHGLSYTHFDYSDLRIEKQAEALNISLTVTNSGERDGKEIVQLYTSHPTSALFRPAKELKRFAKIALKAGESGRVELSLEKKDLAVWDIGDRKWKVESGTYAIMAGSSAADIRLREDVPIQSDDILSAPALAQSEKAPGYFSPAALDFGSSSCRREFRVLLGRPLPDRQADPGRPFHRNSTIEDISGTGVGKLFYKTAMFLGKKQAGGCEEKTAAMMDAMIKEMPLRNLGMMSGGSIGIEAADSLLLMVNNRFPRPAFFKGAGGLIKALLSRKG